MIEYQEMLERYAKLNLELKAERVDLLNDKAELMMTLADRNYRVVRLMDAIKTHLNDPTIKDIYDSHKNIDEKFAEDVPEYKVDCENLVRTFDGLIEVLEEV
jgi:hypothetical protein